VEKKSRYRCTVAPINIAGSDYNYYSTVDCSTCKGLLATTKTDSGKRSLPFSVFISTKIINLTLTI